jgi:Nuclease-related domain
MRTGRWTAVSQSAFEWEREALDFLRQHLPDREPWRAWSNFEFIDDEGRVNEVDVLVLTPAGLVLVEVKSRPGTLRGDAYSWTWTIEGRQVTTDNPLPLANRKAKRLAAVLRRQEAFGRAHHARASGSSHLSFFLQSVSVPCSTPVLRSGLCSAAHPAHLTMQA